MFDVINNVIDKSYNDNIEGVVLLVFILVMVLLGGSAVGIFKLLKIMKPKLDEYTESRIEETNYHKQIQQNNADILELRADTNDALKRIEEVVTKIEEIDDVQNIVLCDTLGHMLTTMCNDALDKKEIKASELQTILRLYKSYSKPPLNGNSYVHILVIKAKDLPLVNDGTESYLHEYEHISRDLEEFGKI